MADPNQIGAWYVDISAAGLSALGAAAATVQQQFTSLETVFQGTLAALRQYGVEARGLAAVAAELDKATAAARRYNEEQRRGLLEQRQASARVGGAALGMVSGAITRGLSGTTEGAYISFLMQQLHREVSALFYPAILKVVDGLTRLVTWFQRLTAAQQETIGYVALVVAGALAAGPQLSALAAGIRVVTLAISANPILAIVGAMLTLLTATEEGRRSLMQLGKALMPIVIALGKDLANILNEIAPLVQTLAEVLTGLAGAITAVVEIIREAAESLGISTGGRGGAIGPGRILLAVFTGGASEIVRGALALFNATRVPLLGRPGAAPAPAANFLPAPIMMGVNLGLGGGGGGGGAIAGGAALTPRHALTPVAGPHEDALATFRRLQVGALRADVAREQRQEMIQHLAVISALAPQFVQQLQNLAPQPGP